MTARLHGNLAKNAAWRTRKRITKIIRDRWILHGFVLRITTRVMDEKHSREKKLKANPFSMTKEYHHRYYREVTKKSLAKPVNAK